MNHPWEDVCLLSKTGGSAWTRLAARGAPGALRVDAVGGLGAEPSAQRGRGLGALRAGGGGAAALRGAAVEGRGGGGGGRSPSGFKKSIPLVVLVC